MDVVRAPQGLDAPDNVALGLDATHLFYLVLFSMSGWALLTSGLPLILRLPGGLLLLTCGVAMAFGQYRQRPVDQWIALYVQYRLRDLAQQRTRFDKDDSTFVAVPSPSTSSSASHVRRARRVAFYSETGGAGKTTLALELAALAAQRCPGGVAVIDADPVSSTMRIRAGIDGPALPGSGGAGVAAIEAALQRHPAGMRVCCMPDGGLGVTAGNAGHFGEVLEYLDAQGYALVVVDMGTALAARGYAWARELLLAMDSVYCVFNPTAQGVFGVYRAVATLRRIGARRIRLVSNRHDHVVDLAEVVADLRVGHAFEVPSLPDLRAAEDGHDCASLANRAAASALVPLVDDVSPTYLLHQLAQAGGMFAGG